MENNLAEVRIEVAHENAGVDWSEEEQSRFCEHLKVAVSSVYPEVTVEVTVTPLGYSRTWVYGKESHNRMVTAPRTEDELLTDINEIVQEVWNNGRFW